jgi:hypothetical protein
MLIPINGVWVPIVMLIMVGVTAIGFPIAKAIARRIERGGDLPKVPSDSTKRLERMEQAIEAIALEVERISEGQRFTTKLLSERADAPPTLTPVSRAGNPPS